MTRPPENTTSDEDFYGLIDNAENLGVIAAASHATKIYRLSLASVHHHVRACRRRCVIGYCLAMEAI